MNRWGKQTGFTIVELLIVVIVIAILATVTIVAFNGIRDRARDSQLQSAISQANKKVLAHHAENSDTYPASLAAVGINDDSNVVYQYTSDNSATPRTYAVTATNGPLGTVSYYVSTAQTRITSGIAPTHNLIPWYKAAAGAAVPLTAGSVDTARFRSGDRSIRLNANTLAVQVRNLPIQVTTGETYRVEFWMQSDTNWNGTNDNSKVRWADGNGNLLAACGYSGVKVAWTRVVCDHTVTGNVTALNVSVGNNGTAGAIWLDDMSFSKL